MRIDNIHASAEVSGIQASAFGFEMNAKMYDILISKMYTNKPGAVIRELSANAWDAHVEAGNTDKPFEIHLPTWLDKTFSLRDYGTGIPHDKFEHIYTNVGSSTKEGTDKLIGGFGLGSKAPFTMTDTFVVENWYGGIKTTWICFKDKGVPQVSRVGEEPSDEPSGLKVSFSFDQGDVAEFTKQIAQQLQFFPLKPLVTGGEGPISWPALPLDWDTKDYFFSTDVSYYNRRCYVVMGNVCYKLDGQMFPYEYRGIFDAGVTLKVPIGAVDIPPSREHLEMTPKTIAFIQAMLDRIKVSYTAEFTAQLHACTTELEARKVAINVNGNLFSKPSFDSITWRGLTLRSLTSSSISDLGGYVLYTLNNVKGNMRYRSTYMNIRSSLENKVVLYVNDLWAGHKSHIEDNCDKLAQAGDKKLIVVQPYASSVKERNAALAQCIAVITEEYGQVPIKLSTVIGAVPKVAKGTQVAKTEPNQVFKLTHVPSEGSILRYCVEVTGDLPTDGYYMELSGHTIYTGVTRYRELLEHGLANRLGKPLYLVRAKTIPKLTGVELLAQKHIDAISVTLEREAFQTNALIHLRDQLLDVPDDYMDVLSKTKDRTLKAYIRYARYVHRKAQNTVDLRPLARVFNPKVKFPSKPLSPSVSTARGKYEPIHELLRHINASYSTEVCKRRMTALKNLIN